MTHHQTIRPIPSMHITTAAPPPEWALLQRNIITILNEVAIEFVHRYTRPDGTLIWREEWPGMDGSDDPYEGFMHFPLFYILGGSQEIHDISRKLWDSITWQWTQYGQIDREYDAYYDWMHHGESNLYIYYYGLADPTVLKDRQRALSFAEMYMGDDPESLNYDKEKKLIRSPINGSRGPRFEQTAEDWCTHREVLDNYPPPFEDIPGVPGPKCQWTDDRIYEEVLQRINARMSRGDVPLNLTATSLITHAYLYTGEHRYRRWVIEYLGAWQERTEKNGGITPDNVGLSGEIGEYNDGKWWGGYYGWRWPHGSFTIIEPLVVAGCNAAIMEQDLRYLDLARSQIDLLWSLRQEQVGQWLVPNKHLDAGWSDYRPMNPWYPLYCWIMSMNEADLERVERIHSAEDWDTAKTYTSKGFFGNHGPWFNYIRGRNPDYPVKILRKNLEFIREQTEAFRANQGDPATWDVHHWQQRTPMILEGLLQLTLGAPIHIYHGGLLYARVRYFDEENARPGLPDNVAALVEQLAEDSVTLQMVNVSPLHERRVIIQAGTFGEHQFEEVITLDEEGRALQRTSVNDKWVSLNLDPGAVTKLKLRMKRYVNQPTYETPWVPAEQLTFTLKGRKKEIY